MDRERRLHSLRLAGVVVAMFAFGYALVPMYRVICQISGMNLQANEMRASAADLQKVDGSRWVTVQFVTTVNGGRDWKFHPDEAQVRVHPGELTTVKFHAENPVGRPLVAQAVPSIAPFAATKLLRKTECFCFRRQTFQAHETKEMPVRFVLDPSLPADVDTVTLSYTFFDVTQVAQR
jgi:cytochrome c oxidase assembly protein subunit 11